MTGVLREHEAREIVYLVGAGPGDPGLITVRGRKLIESADAIVYDALANRRFFLPARVRTGHPELYYVGKRGGDSGIREHRTKSTRCWCVLRREGKRVVRLKGGDPFVFGRGSEEAQALNDASVPFEVVPGVTAGIAAPAYAGIPVTHRGIETSVTFVTGHEDPAQARHADELESARAGGRDDRAVHGREDASGDRSGPDRRRNAWRKFLRQRSSGARVRQQRTVVANSRDARSWPPISRNNSRRSSR